MLLNPNIVYDDTLKCSFKITTIKGKLSETTKNIKSLFSV